VIDPGMPTDTDGVRKLATRLGLDETSLRELLDDVASARRVYRTYKPLHATFPTPLDIAKDIRSHLAYVAQTKEQMLSLLTLTPWRGDRSKADELAHDILGGLSGAERFLESELALLGDVGSRSSTNARKHVRDLLWNELLKIWTARGGKDTGNDAAEFLIEASKPVLGAAAPTTASACQWLLRRRNSGRA
jgi:hypothetical protein